MVHIACSKHIFLLLKLINVNNSYQFHKELSFNDAIPYESHWGVCYPPKMGHPIFVAQI